MNPTYRLIRLAAAALIVAVIIAGGAVALGVVAAPAAGTDEEISIEHVPSCDALYERQAMLADRANDAYAEDNEAGREYIITEMQRVLGQMDRRSC